MPLSPGRNYSYDVGFQPQPSVPDAVVLQPADAIARRQTLRTLGLLADGTVNGRPHKALGYVANAAARVRAAADRAQATCGCCTAAAGARASSTTAPTARRSYRRARLRRRPDRRVAARRRRTPTTRPHQLFLTGDQIYADDVDLQMLPQLNRLGTHADRPRRAAPAHLAAEGPRREQGGLPRRAQATRVRDDPRVRRRPSARRGRTRSRAQARPPRARAGGPAASTTSSSCSTAAAATPSTPTRHAGSPRRWDATLENFPAGLRGPVLSCEAKFSSTDVRNHLMTVGEYCALYLDVWSNAGLGGRAPASRRSRPSSRSTRTPAQPLAAVGAARPLQGPDAIRARPTPTLLEDAGQARAREAAAPTQRINTLTDVLRLAAARASRAGQRPDVHDLRRPRRHRRLEHRRARGATRSTRRRSGAGSSPARWWPTRSSRTGATTRSATA